MTEAAFQPPFLASPMIANANKTDKTTATDSIHSSVFQRPFPNALYMVLKLEDLNNWWYYSKLGCHINALWTPYVQSTVLHIVLANHVFQFLSLYQYIQRIVVKWSILVILSFIFTM